jgi:hypothetical protein
MNNIDINNSDYYEYDKPTDRTYNRLKKIIDIGLVEVGYGEFGYPGLMSGLYIEKVWSYTDDNFNDYINWTEELIKNKTNGFKR